MVSMAEPEAAVAVVWSQTEPESVLLMRRAERDGDPWSGHWSFPGGHIDPEDSDLLHTALRELREECSLDVDRLLLQEKLPVAMAGRKGSRVMSVAPFVFAVEREQAVVVDPREAVEARWVPLSVFEDPVSHHLCAVPGMPPEMLFPVIDLAPVPLWGFTYRLVTTWLGLAPPLEYSAATAAEVLERLVKAGLALRQNWQNRIAVVAGTIPVEAMLANLAALSGEIPAVNVIHVQPAGIRIVGLGMEEYVIRAEP